MKNALLTGASGFLGRHIFTALEHRDFNVDTLGRNSASTVVCDLVQSIPTLNTPYDLVVHAAGKAHIVPKNKQEADDFFAVNLQGTKNLCGAFDALGHWPKAFIFISTVAVYGKSAGENISEQHPLEGDTPYAKSKIEAEGYLTTWAKYHQVGLSILRLPLVVGLNAPGNLGAMVEAIKKNRYFNIGKGDARKSMVMANDVAAYIPAIAAVGGTYNLTDGHHPSFKELSEVISRELGKPLPKHIPMWIARLLAVAGNFFGKLAPINTDKLQKITATLTFENTLAKITFAWQPQKVVEAFTLK